MATRRSVLNVNDGSMAVVRSAGAPSRPIIRMIMRMKEKNGTAKNRIKAHARHDLGR
jgi:hypothetical protein